ncbi:MAG: ThiF family adenylyltransferase, partial [Candidatus Subteraquimicrobiales bacterium]|nr:ThiF family adenylyltransferase [Candidatus Subteraquimicrobiales bacterium]
AYRAALKSPFSTNIRAVNSDILELGWGFLETFDLIFSPVDNIATRYFLNKGALLTKKPHITLGTNFIGTHTFTGEIIYIPQEARACLECIWAIPASIELTKKLQCKGLDEKRELQPQVMCFSSIVSGIASNIGLKYLLGKSKSLDKSYHYVVANNGTVKEFIQSESHCKCSLHSRGMDINKIDTLEVSKSDTMSNLCKKIQHVFEDSIDCFEISLEWSEIHNVVYDPENPINILYIEMNDSNVIPEFLQMSHIYLIRGKEKEKLIRLELS